MYSPTSSGVEESMLIEYNIIARSFLFNGPSERYDGIFYHIEINVMSDDVELLPFLGHDE